MLQNSTDELEYQRRLLTYADALSRNAQDGPISTYQPSYTIPFQRWYKFKEAFSPQLVLDELARRARPTHMCDPFGGSGTTALVAKYLGLRSTTLELNPFLSDVIRAKLSTYKVDQTDTAFARILKTRGRGRIELDELRERAPKTLIEPGLAGRFIFPREVAARILALRSAINEEPNASIRRLFRVMLAAVMVPLSNVVVNGKGRRYRRGWREAMASPIDVDLLLRQHYALMRSDLRWQALRTPALTTVVNGDARQVGHLVRSPIDFAIFSPPYPNSFDYTDIYNIELWMLGYLKDMRDNRALRMQTLRSHVQIKHADVCLAEIPVALQRIVTALSAKPALWSKRLPSMILGYFADLERVIRQLESAMPRGGDIVCVVGDSMYRDVLVDVPLVLEQLFDSGRTRFIDSRTLRTMKASAQHEWDPMLKESAVTFHVTPY